MSREAYAVVALGIIAAGVLALEPLLVWTQVYSEMGLNWTVVMPSLGFPLLCLVATLIAAWTYGLRSVAAGAVIAIGLLATWGSAWRLVSPIGGYLGWLSLVGGLMAIAAGIGLIYARTAAPPKDLVASSEVGSPAR